MIQTHFRQKKKNKLAFKRAAFQWIWRYYLWTSAGSRQGKIICMAPFTHTDHSKRYTWQSRKGKRQKIFALKNRIITYTERKMTCSLKRSTNWVVPTDLTGFVFVKHTKKHFKANSAANWESKSQSKYLSKVFNSLWITTAVFWISCSRLIVFLGKIVARIKHTGDKSRNAKTWNLWFCLYF